MILLLARRAVAQGRQYEVLDPPSSAASLANFIRSGRIDPPLLRRPKSPSWPSASTPELKHLTADARHAHQRAEQDRLRSERNAADRSQRLIELTIAHPAGHADAATMWLMAQSVPSASLIPCLQLVPVDWTVAEVTVNNGRSVITLDHDRGGTAAMVVRLCAACDLAGATEVTSERHEPPWRTP